MVVPRPYLVLQNPVFPPYVCIQCGVGQGRREWFVDLGFTIDQYFDVDNKAIYLCNECYNGMLSDVGQLLLKFRQEHERWEGAETPTYSTYERMMKNDRPESESGQQDSGTTGNQQQSTTVTSGTDGNDQDTESDNPEPESTDSGNAISIDDSNPDESTGFSVKFNT